METIEKSRTVKKELAPPVKRRATDLCIYGNSMQNHLITDVVTFPQTDHNSTTKVILVLSSPSSGLSPVCFGRQRLGCHSVTYRGSRYLVEVVNMSVCNTHTHTHS